MARGKSHFSEFCLSYPPFRGAVKEDPTEYLDGLTQCEKKDALISTAIWIGEWNNKKKVRIQTVVMYLLLLGEMFVRAGRDTGLGGDRRWGLALGTTKDRKSDGTRTRGNVEEGRRRE